MDYFKQLGTTNFIYQVGDPVVIMVTGDHLKMIPVTVLFINLVRPLVSWPEQQQPLRPAMLREMVVI